MGAIDEQNAECQGILAKLKEYAQPRTDESAGEKETRGRVLNEELFIHFMRRPRQISTFEQVDPSERLPNYVESLDASLMEVSRRVAHWPDILRGAIAALPNQRDWHTPHAISEHLKELPITLLIVYFKASLR